MFFPDFLNGQNLNKKFIPETVIKKIIDLIFKIT